VGAICDPRVTKISIEIWWPMRGVFWENETALLPTGVAQAVTVKDVEVRKEDARLELMELLRENVGREYSAEADSHGCRN
jgi:hypothetical protein